MIHRHDEDATIWIGYADFLTTLTILFFILAVVFVGKYRYAIAEAQSEEEGLAPGFIEGVVEDAARKQALASCKVQIGNDVLSPTSGAGRFFHRIDAIRDKVTVSLNVACPDYGKHSELVSVAAGDTARRTIWLLRDTTVLISSLPGDALFGRNQSRLRVEAVTMINEQVLPVLQLQPDDMVMVVGHTDEQPFKAGSEINNWILSAHRAEAAAKVLTEPQYGIKIPKCQVAIMGFGPARPVDPVRAEDSEEVKEEKRKKNRRIEFVKLRGAHITKGACADG